MDWIEGDMTGVAMPVHPAALEAAGADWLTAAFRRFGALGADNAVARVTRFEDCPRGSTGRKVLLGVEYAKPAPGLHDELFVKFSRALDDPLRDNQRYEMADEARFAALSTGADFPIAVPRAYFSDFHGESGTGMMITQCIPYGEGANEPHYEKCLDWQMADAIDHYRVIVGTNARLAAAHRAGRLSGEIDRWFPYDRDKAIAADRIRYDARQLGNRVARFAQFCGDYPQLLPANVRDAGFHARLARDVPRFLEHEQGLREWLFGRPGSIVFAHWNANIDNAWFWKGEARDGQTARHCGFIDWGRVGPMPVAQALWGTLSGAETVVWDRHLDELIGVYVAAFDGLPAAQRLDVATVRLELEMQVGLLGICWLLDAVPLILRMVPDLAEAESKRDRRFVEHEQARNQLHMLTVFMNLFERHDLGARLDEVLARIGSGR